MKATKPASTLTELESEPVTYFGCTWSEIMRAIRESLIIGAGFALLLITVISITISSKFALLFAVFMFVITLTTLLLTRFKLASIANLRAGKPLFYERHSLTARSAHFHQPQKRYQRERNE